MNKGNIDLERETFKCLYAMASCMVCMVQVMEISLVNLLFKNTLFILWIYILTLSNSI